MRYNSSQTRYFRKKIRDFILVYRQNPSIDFHDREDIRLITFSNLYKLVKTRQSFKGSSPLQFTKNADKKKLDCREAFNVGNCTLFVGAGVSMSANLPSWENLLYKILGNLTEKDVIKNEDKVFFKRALDGSNMVMGRYLSTLSNLNSKTKSEVALIEEVKSALYPKEVNKDCH